MLLLALACSSSDNSEIDSASDSSGDDGSSACGGSQATTGIEVGSCAPDFTLSDRDGMAHSLSDYSGDLVLIGCSAMW